MAAKKKTSIPRFGIDPGQFGTLILGRRFVTDLDVEAVKVVHATTAKWREESGLPLVFVSPGPAEQDDDSSAGDCFYAGILLASAKEGGKPVTVDKSLLDVGAADRIPAGFWEALESDHALSTDPEAEIDEEEGPSTGVFLAPAGWAVATLRLGDDEDTYLLTTSSEDTSVGKRLSEATIVEVTKSKEPLKLVGEYC